MAFNLIHCGCRMELQVSGWVCLVSTSCWVKVGVCQTLKLLLLKLSRSTMVMCIICVCDKLL